MIVDCASTHPPMHCSTCARLAVNALRLFRAEPGQAVVAERCGAHEATVTRRITAGR